MGAGIELGFVLETENVVLNIISLSSLIPHYNVIFIFLSPLENWVWWSMFKIQM